MNKSGLYFIHEETDEAKEISSFLNPYFTVSEENLTLSLENMKTKDLYSEIEKRQIKYNFDYLLIESQQQLLVFDSEKRKIHIDFDNDKSNYARKVIAKDPFLRAIGRDRKNVLDVSGGLGIDAVFLAQHGHDVVAIERNPLLYTLLRHAHKKSRMLKKWNIRFDFADAAEYVEGKALKDQFDCIYFDPMFPDKAKSALPRQEMVLFRKLVGQDTDAEKILEKLLKIGTRVVVKRPAYAPPVGFKPTNCFESKLIRFDIY